VGVGVEDDPRIVTPTARRGIIRTGAPCSRRRVAEGSPAIREHCVCGTRETILAGEREDDGGVTVAIRLNGRVQKVLALRQDIALTGEGGTFEPRALQVRLDPEPGDAC